MVITNQSLLDQAEVCSRALERVTNPADRIALWHLRALWRAMVKDGCRLFDLPDHVEVLTRFQDSIIAKLGPTLH